MSFQFLFPIYSTWNLFKSNKEVIKRLDEAIEECEKAIKTYKEMNLHEEVLQERWTLNELKYVKTGNFTDYLNEKENISHEQLCKKYDS